MKKPKYSPKKRNARSAAEVILGHLREGKWGNVDSDLQENFSPNVSLLTSYGTFHGFAGMRSQAALLRQQLPDSSFKYKNVLIEKDVGFLEWTADSEEAYVDDGADSYVVKDGQIVAQTIHYTVKRKTAG